MATILLRNALPDRDDCQPKLLFEIFRRTEVVTLKKV